MRIVKDWNQDYEQFRFPGNGREGTCFLRLQARQEDQRIVIFCSQLKNYNGTSVTNAIEFIVRQALSSLATEGIVRSPPSPPHLSWMARFLAHIRGTARQAPVSPVPDIRELITYTTCIEHYPPNVGLAEKGSYALVSFDDGFNPVWNYVTREAAAKKAGVDDLFLTISAESLNYAS